LTVSKVVPVPQLFTDVGDDAAVPVGGKLAKLPSTILVTVSAAAVVLVLTAPKHVAPLVVLK
jgi:hypothetical protein